MRHTNKLMGTIAAAILLSTTPAWAQEATQPKAGAIQIVQTDTKQAPTNETTSAKQQLPAKVEASLAQLKELIPSLNSLTTMQKQYIPNLYGNGINGWSITISDRPEKADDSKRYTTAFLDFDAKSGKLLNMSYRNDAWASPQMPTKEFAKEKAAAFLQSLIGAAANNYKIRDQIGNGIDSYPDPVTGEKKQSAHATVHFTRLINNIPLAGYEIIIAVDQGGHILHYQSIESAEPDVSKFPDPSKALSLPAAKTALSKELQGKLTYNSTQPLSVNQQTGATDTKPVLKYDFNALPLHALTGETVEYYKSPEEGPGIPLTLKPSGKGFTIDSRAKAESFLKEELNFDVTGLEFRETSYPREDGIQTINYSWMALDEHHKDPRHATVVIDKSNHQIVHITTERTTPAKKDGYISKEKAQEIAEQFLSKYVTAEKKALITHLELVENPFTPPAWVDESKLDKDLLKDYRAQYGVVIHGLHNNILIQDDSFSFSIDAATGEFNHFSAHTVKPGTPLPSSDTYVSLADAQKTFVEATELQLEYVWPQFFGQMAPEPLLVYTPSDDWRFVDAVTGKLIPVEMK
ncbi:YcdB/YcdC domain-containing protein [Brevibacillus dissolubilis]|uniref:YcdB/YcdC domain-containing protein n=1 Tax=Brevibacillus dissolubilis TaxID=1844116 RepID=UPI001116B5D7|nr:YcdB/YcdC domain-containing protein [Brevibacillus dissolubilis]